MVSAWQKLDGESLQNAGLSNGRGDLVCDVHVDDADYADDDMSVM